MSDRINSICLMLSNARRVYSRGLSPEELIACGVSGWKVKPETVREHVENARRFGYIFLDGNQFVLTDKGKVEAGIFERKNGVKVDVESVVSGE